MAIVDSNPPSATQHDGSQPMEDGKSAPEGRESTAEEVRQDASGMEEPGSPEKMSAAGNESEVDSEAFENLAVARNQDDLEQAIGRQADQMLVEQADERDNKRLEKTQNLRNRVQNEMRRLEARIRNSIGSVRMRSKQELEAQQRQMDIIEKDLEQISKRMKDRHEDQKASAAEGADKSGNVRRPGESKRDFLIRTGKITPFSNFGQNQVQVSASLADVMLDAEERSDNGQLDDDDDDDAEDEDGEIKDVKQKSHRNLMKPGFLDSADGSTSETSQSLPERPSKRRRVVRKVEDSDLESQGSNEASGDDFVPEGGDRELYGDAGSESDMALTVQGTEEEEARRKRKGQRAKRKKLQTESDAGDVEDLTGVDDGDESLYQARLERWVHARRAAREKARNRQLDGDTTESVSATDEREPEDDEEWFMPHPTRADTTLSGGLRIPGDIYPSLFDYQKTGVQWLWELYTQQTGGIIGDEMGLGKTVQIISFLGALHYSKRYTRPIVVVAPATVMRQWVNEFHRWWPALRVSILHTSGSGMMDVGRERRFEDDLEANGTARTGKAALRAAVKIIDRVVADGHVLVTTYSGLLSYEPVLVDVDWGYAVLDEGHKIRNPNTYITQACKKLRTSNRIILSGTPMQNNLVELWSLFDFVFPLRLGTLVNFRNQFEIPIRQGGYASASNLAVETALQCAETLKDTISPYLLQRLKVDVAADLPKKTEQVLLCKLTKLQRSAYEDFLRSNDMTSIMEGKRQVLYGIDILRKICNHPDLVHHAKLSKKIGYDYGASAKSGKMKVLQGLLQRFRDNGHKTLLFAQHRIMLDILEGFLHKLGSFKYRRMDGTTQIKDRQDMIDEFNKDQELDVFLLTTKVGGLGINLTGADRVIIYDPDWNPSTDIQARERAWRLGQKREVEIYRLMTVGTIEEKIYHRQLFKQFLTNKILRDPKQRQTFHLRDLHDLFTLGSADDLETETGAMFKGTSRQFDDGETSTSLSDVQPEKPKPENLLSVRGIARQLDFKDDNDDVQRQSSNTPANSEKHDHETDSGVSNPNANNSGSRLMSTIFTRSDVHSAIDHDAIMGSRTGQKAKVAADPTIIAAEAKRVAAQAASELQRLRDAAGTIPIGTPTWTGTVGSAGRLDEPSTARGATSGRGRGGTRGGPSSSSVLANLSARQNNMAGGPPGESDQPRGTDFVEMIRKYLVAHGGAVYTQMLIEHFNRFCGTPQRTAEFKEMLKQIAVLERTSQTGSSRRGRGVLRGPGDGGGGRGRWVLKRSWGGTGDG